MQKKLLNKSLVIGIIVFFIGASVYPSSGIMIEENILTKQSNHENNYNHNYDKNYQPCVNMKNKIFKEIYETEKKEDEYGKPVVNNNLPDYFYCGRHRSNGTLRLI